MIFITHERSEGRTGHHFKDAITPLIVAEMFGFTYVYTEYKSLELFNLEESRLTRNHLPPGIRVHRIEGPHWLGISYDDLMTEFSNVQNQFRNEDCLVVLANSFRIQLFQLYQWYTNGQTTTNLYAHIVGLLRKNFQARNPRDANPAQPGRKMIAVHIRRGDVANPRKQRTPSSQHYAHSMEYYDDILKTLRNHFREHEPEILVFTEHLNAEDVVSYCSKYPDILLHQGGKPEFGEHFRRMVYSDILVVSNSSMSQMAGYICEGFKIYHPNDQYHGLPADEFIPVDELKQERSMEMLAKAFSV